MKKNDEKQTEFMFLYFQESKLCSVLMLIPRDLKVVSTESLNYIFSRIQFHLEEIFFLCLCFVIHLLCSKYEKYESCKIWNFSNFYVNFD